jgi:hypothetical protein
MKATVVPFRDSSLGGVERAETVSASPAWRSFARAPALTEVDPAGGIEVREQELVRVTAQRLYMVRCECGRRWFELERPALVECPACHRLGSLAG